MRNGCGVTLQYANVEVRHAIVMDAFMFIQAQKSYGWFVYL